MFSLPDFYKDFTAELDLNEDNIRQCNNNSQFSAGDSIVNSANSVYRTFFNHFAFFANYTDEQKKYLLDRASKWRTLVESAFNEELRRRANFVPWNVAGPAKYNFKKAGIQVERDLKNRSEWENKIKAFLSNTAEGLDRLSPIEKILDDIKKGYRNIDTVKADDKYALEKLNARLEYLTETQADMKNANKYYRKNGTMIGFFTNESKAKRLDKEIKNTWYQQPFAPFELTSINEKIKRIKSRIDHISKTLVERPFKDFEFDGGNVIANYEEDRLQVFFDSKPDEKVRTVMKSNGFRWAPSQCAWQRQLTKNAYNSARLIFEIKDDENEPHRKEDS